MSVTSAGKRPGAATHPLRAGQSGRGVRRGTGGGRGRPRLTLVPPIPSSGSPGPQARGGSAVLPSGAVPRPRVPQDGLPSEAAQEAGARIAPGPGEPGQEMARPVAPGPRMPRDAGLREVPPRPARYAVRAGAVPGRDVPGVRRGRDRRPVRLTRRGRCVLWVAAGLILAAILTPVLLMAATGAQAANHGVPASAVRAGMRAVKVRPGDSLWSIALRAEPKADPRVVSQKIIQFNALSSNVLVPGETLWVPRG